MKKNNKNKADKQTKKILTKLDQVHKNTQAIFKEDKAILKELKRVINAQQRKAS